MRKPENGIYGATWWEVDYVMVTMPHTVFASIGGPPHHVEIMYRFFLAGDPNIQPDNAAYKTLVPPGVMHDLKNIVPPTHWHGNALIFAGFTSQTSDDTRLDHIFVKDPPGTQFLT
jgi:hypothetical protein